MCYKEYISEEEVFDITVDNKSHTYWTDRCNVSNCGEIVLCDKDSCRLLLLNLYGYVIDPFTKNAKFDYVLFEKHVQIAERYMDDIVDLELEKIDKILEKIESDPESEETKRTEKNLWLGIKDKCIRGRRTGLGITGLGDMLAALNLKYGTTEATEFAINIQKFVAINAFKSSVIMAKERGAFPIFNMNLEYKSEFLKRLYKESPELEEMTKLYGRRNIALLTCAPAGCLVEDTIIKTDRGDIKLVDLFLVNGINLNNLRGLKNLWIDLIDDIYVFNINGEKNKITKLYWNGLDNTKKITYSDNSTTESTLEHKFLVKLNEKEAIWKKTNDLKIGDKILKFI